MLVIGLLALKYVPVLFLPILLIAVGVHFSGDFSFIADFLEIGIVTIVGIPFIFITWLFIREQINEFKASKKSNDKI